MQPDNTTKVPCDRAAASAARRMSRCHDGRSAMRHAHLCFPPGPVMCCRAIAAIGELLCCVSHAGNIHRGLCLAEHSQCSIVGYCHTPAILATPVTQAQKSHRIVEVDMSHMFYFFLLILHFHNPSPLLQTGAVLYILIPPDQQNNLW